MSSFAKTRTRKVASRLMLRIAGAGRQTSKSDSVARVLLRLLQRDNSRPSRLAAHGSGRRGLKDCGNELVPSLRLLRQAGLAVSRDDVVSGWSGTPVTILVLALYPLHAKAHHPRVDIS